MRPVPSAAWRQARHGARLLQLLMLLKLLRWLKYSHDVYRVGLGLVSLIVICIYIYFGQVDINRNEAESCCL